MGKHRKLQSRAPVTTFIVEYRITYDGEKRQMDVRGVRSEEEAKRKLVQILKFEPAWMLASQIG